MNFEGAKKYIIDRLKNELSPTLYYHGLHHTLDVHNAAEKLAALEGVIGEELILLKTAALFHDAGFIEMYSHNESIGAKIAKETLLEFNYNQRQIDTIASVIMVTDMSKPPRTILEKIMCDADLDYLGRDDFKSTAALLKKELYANGIQHSESQWDAIQINFLEKHKYYTDSAIKKNQDAKQKHLEEIKERLKKYLNI